MIKPLSIASGTKKVKNPIIVNNSCKKSAHTPPPPPPPPLEGTPGLPERSISIQVSGLYIKGKGFHKLRYLKE